MAEEQISVSGMQKVFLSSTFTDLQSYRQAAIKTIHRFGWFAVAMEDFLSRDDRPKDLCLNLVRSSQLYIGLFAHRYGHVPQGDTRSITEQEYRCAREQGIECLLFIVDEQEPWRKEWIDRGDAEGSLLRLKKELRDQHSVSFFTSPENLAVLISASLAIYTRTRLMNQLLDWTHRAARSGDDQIPTVKVRVFRHPNIATDVRCLVINESDFPTRVKTLLHATVNNKFYDSPVPGHYSGCQTWDLPARDGYEGHFDMEKYLLHPAELTYDAVLLNPTILEIAIDYFAVTHFGQWHEMGTVRYRYDFAESQWVAHP